MEYTSLYDEQLKDTYCRQWIDALSGAKPSEDTARSRKLKDKGSRG